MEYNYNPEQRAEGQQFKTAKERYPVALRQRIYTLQGAKGLIDVLANTLNPSKPAVQRPQTEQRGSVATTGTEAYSDRLIGKRESIKPTLKPESKHVPVGVDQQSDARRQVDAVFRELEDVA